MGLRNVGDSFAAEGSCGGGAVREVPLGSGGGSMVMTSLVGSGGSSGQTTDSVSGESRPASLASIHVARVLVGRPRGPIWIRVICLYISLLGGDSGTDMTLIGLSSSSSSTTVTPGDFSERWLGLRVPSASRSVVQGRETVAVA
jgi:hypothetical protein